MILIIDNYDSFVYNLARYIERLGGTPVVVRNDKLTVGDAEEMKPQAVVLSPGPCTPLEAGVSLDLARQLHAQVPMLGVCLGHQVIAQALGGQIVPNGAPWHGRSSCITHSGDGLFAGIPSPLTVGRYHSLEVEPQSLPAQLEATAWTTNGATLMAFAHRDRPIFGVQFHPESILTQCGYQLLQNFLKCAGISSTQDPAVLSASERVVPVSRRPVPSRPVTF